TTDFGRPDLPELVSPATRPACLLFIGSSGPASVRASCRPSPLQLRLGPLRPVLAAAALPALHADRIQGPPDDVVPDARKVLHAAPADQHDRVLLEVVPHARDVRGDLDPVGQPDSRDLSEGRVRLLRRRGEHADANPALLRTSLECRAVGLRLQVLPTDPD